MNFFLSFAFLVNTLSIHPQTSAFQVEGIWYREDGIARKIYSVPEGIKLVTENETFLYYTIGDNLYRMNWTPGTTGTRYRWTLKVKSLTVIENTYENESVPGTVITF
jgi:hypothetical protein